MLRTDARSGVWFPLDDIVLRCERRWQDRSQEIHEGANEMSYQLSSIYGRDLLISRITNLGIHFVSQEEARMLWDVDELSLATNKI